LRGPRHGSKKGSEIVKKRPSRPKNRALRAQEERERERVITAAATTHPKKES